MANSRIQGFPFFCSYFVFGVSRWKAKHLQPTDKRPFMSSIVKNLHNCVPLSCTMSEPSPHYLTNEWLSCSPQLKSASENKQLLTGMFNCITHEDNQLLVKASPVSVASFACIISIHLLTITDDKQTFMKCSSVVLVSYLP